MIASEGCVVKLGGQLNYNLLKPEEGCGNNRSVMPSDVLGCTRATLISTTRTFRKEASVERYERFILFVIASDSAWSARSR